MLAKFGSERVIGMLHAFSLLKPSIEQALLKHEQAQVKASLLESKFSSPNDE